MLLPYRDHTFLRILSARTGETLFEIKMLDGSMIVWGANGTPGPEKKSRDLLGVVGLGERLGHYPAQLSGGEQQRLCLARAFINEPDIILADEPTGNLDSKNSAHIMELILELHRVKQATILLVTHEAHIAEKSERILTMQDGSIVQDEPRPAANEKDAP